MDLLLTYAYNPRGFLADLKTTAPQASGGGVISEFGGAVGSASAMTYDAVGNRTGMTGVLNAVGGYQMLGNGSSSSQYAYNGANELTQEQTTEPGNGSYTNTYGYDPAQNRTSLTNSQGTTTLPHNADNQLSAAPSYAYDGNGNPTTYTSPGNRVNASANTTTFDPESRMTAYGVSGSGALPPPTPLVCFHPMLSHQNANNYVIRIPIRQGVLFSSDRPMLFPSLTAAVP